MFGASAQGPSGNAHGGAIAAILDDLIGVTGVLSNFTGHLTGSLQKRLKVNEDLHEYIDLGLKKYEKFSEEEKRNLRLPKDISMDYLIGHRHKRLPYTPSEVAFIFATLGPDIRTLPLIEGSERPPEGLVSQLSITLKARAPLLSRLVTRAYVVSMKGNKVTVRAEIWAKKNSRFTALEEDSSGGFEGEWDVLLAEGEGKVAALYHMDITKGAKGVKPRI